MARAQAKSGWRAVGKRLLGRYMNLRETGTHHSRWVVLSILLVMAAPLLPVLLALLLPLCGSTAPAGLLLITPVCLVLAVLCHLPLLRSAARRLGKQVLPGFTALILADMAALAWGILRGTLGFFAGRRY